jgi:aryl-alcohol dehydrogenase-like predicted oxidoreductase
MHDRQIGTTGIHVSPVALGCWPIAGITSVDVNEADSLATIRACLDLEINFLDTAYCYGYDGESETLIRRALGDRRDQFVIATKGGIHWSPDRSQVQDARPATLLRQCEESLQRLGTDRVELYYLHSPDPNVPVAESAGAIQQMIDEGKVRSAGISNATLSQIEEFHAVCPLSAVQPPYNMLQRGIEREIVPWCRSHDVSVMVFWPLMKGLLAGRMTRSHEFEPDDKRTNFPMYQGDEWQKNQDFLGELREIAAAADKTVAQVVINWTVHRPVI